MKVTEIPAKPKEKQVVRVAAYARVSTDKDAAFHSLEAQAEYYEQLIAAHSDWELAGLYSDNGISGTIINRPEFQRMLEDCRAKKIDLVITKSVTRFARNTVILLQTIRELKSLGIDCYFEKEDMHSISPDGELLLTLLAMYAEEEARSASENQKWRIQKLFEQGIPNTGKMLGYRLRDGELVIVPDEAEVVRKIFDYYLSGMGYGKIAKALMQEGIPCGQSSYWHSNTVNKILKNEKYTGDMILQKTFHEDFRTKKKRINRGERRKYYIENSHSAIISKETFAAVKLEMENRSAKMFPRKDKPENIFKGLVICGQCGSRYCRKNSNGKYSKVVWVCQRYFNLGKAGCQSHKIPETTLLEKTKTLLQTDVLSRDFLLNHIKEIRVLDGFCLQFVFKDGSLISSDWQYSSRKESWTAEMKQRAREKALSQRQKEEK